MPPKSPPASAAASSGASAPTKVARQPTASEQKSAAPAGSVGLALGG